MFITGNAFANWADEGTMSGLAPGGLRWCLALLSIRASACDSMMNKRLVSPSNNEILPHDPAPVHSSFPFCSFRHTPYVCIALLSR